jgi:hypothetical protein
MAQLYNVMLVSTATAVTGSIAKIYACGDNATDTDGDITTLCTVDNITFGSYSNGGTSKITSNISTNFIVANGTYIEGPIYAFKSADTTGRFLVYFNAEY